MSAVAAWVAAAVVAAIFASWVVAAVAIRGPEDGFAHALLRAFAWTYVKVVHRLRVIAPTDDPLPRTGACILVSNHRSGMDPVVLAVATKRRIRFLMAREYYEIPVLHWLFRLVGCIPVNRDGNDFRAVKEALRVLRNGCVVGVFPQGGIRGGAPLGQGKSGVAMLGVRTKAPVVPAWVEGTPITGSALLSVLKPSRTVVRAGPPILPTLGMPERPTREDLDRLTTTILRAVRELAPDSGAV